MQLLCNFIEITLRHGYSPVNLMHIFRSNFTEITLQHGYSPVNLRHIFRTSFCKNTSRWLLLKFRYMKNIYTILSTFWKFLLSSRCHRVAISKILSEMHYTKNEVFHKEMWPLRKCDHSVNVTTANLVTFTEETLNGKLYFLCSDAPTQLAHKCWKWTKKTTTIDSCTNC